MTSAQVYVALGLALLSLSTTFSLPIPEVSKEVGSDSSILPDQVHITSGNTPDHIIVTWTTKSKAPSVVYFGRQRGNYASQAVGDSAKYTRGEYTSGHIHSAKIKGLTPSTTYFYALGGDMKNPLREFSVRTLPAVGPTEDLVFTVVGDLGQTLYSESTVMHVLEDDSQMFTIIAGDLSYADGDQTRWDRWSNLFEGLLSSRPLQVAAGNHEIEIKNKDRGSLEDVLAGVEGFIPFQSYTARFPHDKMKSEDDDSYEALSRKLFHSYLTGPAKFIHLCSYIDFSDGSEQKEWLKQELAEIDRNVTPWVFAVVHAPWYNSNYAHMNEPPLMRYSLEQMMCEAGVDVVFAGHVHAYERMAPSFNGSAHSGGIQYINVGDGGNREGLAVNYIDPQPSWSLVREASYGHGKIQIINGTDAIWTWHRIQDGELVSADTVNLSHTDPTSCILKHIL